MRRKYLLLLVIAILVLIFGYGCPPPEESIEPPQNLVLKGATNEVDLELSWSPSPTEDIDGYIIYFNGAEIADVDADVTHWTHVGPTGVGTYRVTAYRGDEESAAIEASTEPYEGTGELYIRAAPVGYNSAWGWNWTSGEGASYSLMSENKSYIDMYYDNDNTMTSAHILWADGNVTGFKIIDATYDNVGNVPTSGYIDNALIGLNQVYAIVVRKNYTDTWHYVKLKITAVATTPYAKINFNYAYQRVANFTLMD